MINLKHQLSQRKVTIGSWITLGHPCIAEIMVKAGFDWLAVDMEHSAITLDLGQQLIQVIELSGAVPLVRVEENNPVIIKRVMDAGAHGVIVPMVNTKSDAQKAVRAVKYPPVGIRGVGLARAQGYGLSFFEYKEWVNKESIVIVQIEHCKAVDNLKDILSTPGVDGSIIGLYDLSASLGCPGQFDKPVVRNALLRYEAICKGLRKPMGFHIVQPDLTIARLYKKRGYALLAIGIDTLYLVTKCREVREGIRSEKS